MSDPTAETYRPEDDEPVPWEEGSNRLAAADTYWLATVTAAGRAHLVPLLAVWVDEGLHFVAGPATRKARDLAQDRHCSVATHHDGMDLVMEGEAVTVRDPAALGRVAEAYAAKYNWPTTVRAGALTDQDGAPTAGPPPYDVYRMNPALVFGFPSDQPVTPTRWRFS